MAEVAVPVQREGLSPGSSRGRSRRVGERALGGVLLGHAVLLRVEPRNGFLVLVVLGLLGHRSPFPAFRRAKLGNEVKRTWMPECTDTLRPVVFPRPHRPWTTESSKIPASSWLGALVTQAAWDKPPPR